MANQAISGNLPHVGGTSARGGCSSAGRWPSLLASSAPRSRGLLRGLIPAEGAVIVGPGARGVAPSTHFRARCPLEEGPARGCKAVHQRSDGTARSLRCQPDVDSVPGAAGPRIDLCCFPAATWSRWHYELTWVG